MTESKKPEKTFEYYKNLLESNLLEGASRLVFLNKAFFQIDAGGSEHEVFFARKCVEVCQALKDRTTYKYVENADNYRWFLILLNLPFFEKRTMYGVGIRGSWWGVFDEEEWTISTCSIFENNEQITELKFTDDEWGAFMKALIEFAQPEMVTEG